MIKNHDPKIILITGCSSGFGLLIAARLATHGHKVFATMRDCQKKENLENEVTRRGASLTILPLDVTCQKSIKRTVSQIQTQEGRLDVLINNAGFALGGAFEDLTQAEIREQMETNFFGAQNVTREIIPLMRQQGSGQIINISSIAGLYALPGLGAYNASKWALEGFSESLYYELKPFGIHVCMVEPGSYKTKIFFENRKVAAKAVHPESPYYHYTERFKRKVDESIAKDKKDPEEIAILVEKLINCTHPPLRNIPDIRSKILFSLKRLLPFRTFSDIIYRSTTREINPYAHDKTI